MKNTYINVTFGNSVGIEWEIGNGARQDRVIYISIVTQLISEQPTY